MLELDVDPKLAWALAHRERFPVDLNRAPREMLLRVPGLGVKTVDRLLQARRVRRVRAADWRGCACRWPSCCPSSSSPTTGRAARSTPSDLLAGSRPAAARVAVRLSAGAVKELSSPPGPSARPPHGIERTRPLLAAAAPGPATPPRRAR